MIIEETIDNKIHLNVAEDFSDAPGGRYEKDGPNSGEEFYKKLLKPKFLQALESKATLEVNLNGVWGFPVSFTSESFGKLSTEYGFERVLKHLTLISTDEPLLVREIEKIIKDPTFRG